MTKWGMVALATAALVMTGCSAQPKEIHSMSDLQAAVHDATGLECEQGGGAKELRQFGTAATHCGPDLWIAVHSDAANQDKFIAVQKTGEAGEWIAGNGWSARATPAIATKLRDSLGGTTR